MFHLPKYFRFFIAVSLVMVMGLATGCSDLIQIKDESAPASPATIPANPGANVAGGPAPVAAKSTATPSVFSVLPKVSTDAVALSVLITPLDAGFVDIAGERTLSNGQATEVNRNDQINLVARPSDPAKWRFDRWGGDLQGPFASESLIMDSSKKIRAVFVEVDARVKKP